MPASCPTNAAGSPGAASSRVDELVIVSNRLPVRRTEDGWATSPGGLVSALRPVLERRSSAWIGWLGDDANVPDAFEVDGILSRPVPLDADELDAFYEGFSNRSLWPLYHDAVRPPEFHRTWWRAYVSVNERYAAAAARAAAPGGLVWVHDYHLQLVPAMLRALRPDLRIGFFLHIPFPPKELFVQIPWRRAILEGMLGADVVGFQTKQGARNFADLCRRYADASGARRMLSYGDRRVHVDAFPISIDAARYEALARSETVRERADSLIRKIAPGGKRIMLGVDRLDYTKGIDIRLRAFHELLRLERLSPDEWAFVQVAVPSREGVNQYRKLREEVERRVGEINGAFGEFGQMPVHYLHRSFELAELVALYGAADVMLVTPLRDGMNLVAKEFVATRVRDDGALVLSEFAGAAQELEEAVLVNPHDLDGLVDSIGFAATMPRAEQQRRMAAMRRQVRRHDVFAWANGFIAAVDG